MLGKLIKHEFKATARQYLPFLAALLFFTLTTKVMIGRWGLSDDRFFATLQIISVTGYAVSVIGIAVAAFIITIQRFYKNLLGDEGYLMFTLPVRTGALILSKAVTAAVWLVGCGVLALSSILFVVWDTIPQGKVREALLHFLQSTDRIYAAETLLLFAAGGMAALMMVYFSIAVGHMAHKHRVLASIGAYVVITFTLQALGSTALWVLDQMNFTSWLIWRTAGVAHIILLGGTALFLTGAALFFLGTNSLLSRKLNLE